MASVYPQVMAASRLTNQGSTQIRLLIVDDHDILRYGLRALLGANEAIAVVGEADSVEQAVERARELQPDVILMDAHLPDGSGIDACREIRSILPATRVLFLSGSSEEQAVFMAMVAGAQGHVSKDLDLEVLVAAILTVAGGGLVFDPKVRESVARAIEVRSRDLQDERISIDALSPQEERVMALVVEGKTNKEIAQELALSDKTIKNYLYNTFRKLGVGRRAQAASVFDFDRLKRAHAALADGAVPRKKPK
jgi:two-component system response regulator DevR